MAQAIGFNICFCFLVGFDVLEISIRTPAML